jgi:hypothetical protein
MLSKWEGLEVDGKISLTGGSPRNGPKSLHSLWWRRKEEKERRKEEEYEISCLMS